MKVNLKERKKRQKGITLVALVVTIVVLLILAGITISMVTNGGILDSAKEAVGETKNAISKEQELTDGRIKVGDKWYASMDDYLVDTKKDTNPGVLESIGTDTYEINSIEDLVALAYSVNKGEATYLGKTIKLGKNLDFKNDLSYTNPQAKYVLEATSTGYKPDEIGTSIKELLLGDNGFIPIGTYESSGFYGTIKGNNRVIKNMKITSVTALGGLIGKTVASKETTISDLGMEDSDINSNSPAGSVIGWNYGTMEIINCYNTGEVNSRRSVTGGIAGGNDSDISITNCYNKGTVNSDKGPGGGIIGCSYAALEIINCYNAGAVNASFPAGGIIASANNAGSIKNCYNEGTVNSQDELAGGIIGCSYAVLEIINCYNTGAINAKYIEGGIVGDDRNAGSITNCYNVGTINPNQRNDIGAIIGSQSNTTITNCYFMKGSATVGIGSSGTGEAKEKEEAYMKTDAFLNELKGSTDNTVWIREDSKNRGMPTFGKAK